MRKTGITMIIVGLVIGVIGIVYAVSAHYRYSRDIFSNWELSVKASTISQKSEYMDKFVDSLKNSGLQGSSAALFFKTPDQSFDENFKALVSLQSRLHNIQNMDENSFAYQTAIQQITAQEQDEAGTILSVIKSSWYRVHYYLLWNVFGFLMMLLPMALVISGSLVLQKPDHD